MNKLMLYAVCILAVCCSSCIIVKEKDEIIVKNTEYIPSAATPKPEIKMSNKIVRTATGDMMALLPEGWFFIEVDGNLSSEVFAVAVNPEYTMSAVFSQLRKSDEIQEIVDKEKQLGLARAVFSKHEARANGNMKLSDKYHLTEIGLQKFGSFSFIKAKDNTYGTSAVFISSIDEYYEFSLVTMSINNNIQPSKNEFDKVYRSILATLKY